MSKTSKQLYEDFICEFANDGNTKSSLFTRSQRDRVTKKRKFQDIHGVHGTYGWLVQNWEKTAIDLERKLYTRIYRRR